MGVEGRHSFIVVRSIPILLGLIAPRSRAFLAFHPHKSPQTLLVKSVSQCQPVYNKLYNIKCSLANEKFDFPVKTGSTAIKLTRVSFTIYYS